MQVELAQQLFLDIHLRVICAKQKAVREDNGSPATLRQPVHDDGHKQISRLAAGQIIGKVIFTSAFSLPP